MTLTQLLDEYRDRIETRCAADMAVVEGSAIEVAEMTAEEKQARERIDSWISSNTLQISAKHTHQCGTCGQYRECYHWGCFFNQLADCDPETGCKTPPHQFLRIKVL